MGDRLLATIIELENVLQEELQRETSRAAAWREREFAMLAQDLVAVRQRLAAEEGTVLAEARQAAEAESLRLLTATESRCNRLEALPDAFLAKVLRGLLQTLLPEDDDDHPHGQG